MNAQVEGSTRLRGRRLILARLLWWLTCACTALGLMFLALCWSAPVPDTFAFRGHAAMLALAFGIVGQFLARHRQQNLIGWLFLLAGLVSSIQEFGQEYAAYMLFVRADALRGTIHAAWIASWIPTVFLGLTMYVIFLFPTGRFPSDRWRPLAWLIAGAWAVTTFASTIKPGPLRFAPYLDNPFAGSQQIVEFLNRVIGIALGLSVVVVAVSVVVRLRRARGIERQQLKWFTYMGALFCGAGLFYVSAGALQFSVQTSSKPADLLAVFITMALPFSVGFAILRYHLYEIDRVINRTLVYALLTLMLAAIYFGSVVLLQQFVRVLTGQQQSEIVTVISTLAIAALFVPLRRRVQSIIDHRFYRRKYDAQKVLAEFAATARDEVDLQRLTEGLLDVVDETMRPAHVSLWLRKAESEVKR